MKALIELKRSTGSDTASKKSNRWLRIGSPHGEFEHLLDMYWGGTRGRITGMTLRIIAVNAIALLSLMIGVVYLGEYQNRLIQSKLEVFETEIFLITAAVSEGSIVGNSVVSKSSPDLDEESVKRIVGTFGATLGKHIRVFNKQGILIADSKSLIAQKNISPIFTLVKSEEKKWESIEILKRMGGFIVSFLPEHSTLPLYDATNSIYAKDYPDVMEAIQSKISISAWRDKNDDIMLTAAMPIKYKGQVVGAAMLVSDGKDIKKALGDAWFDIIKIFLATLLFTILLSIYLSGVIARPLRKLADAAEKVRKGKIKGSDLPDMSDRKDEIGELSIALIDMTNALWDRMDSVEAFASDVAHELKNPLTSLKSAVETASIVKKKEDQERLLSIIQHDIERMDRLISDISSISRLEAELSREYFEPVELKTLLKKLIDVYKNPLDRSNGDGDGNIAVKNGVKIKIDCPYNEDIFILGSEGRLGQVFHNVISNALSFTPLKGEINIRLRKKQNMVSIIFEDQGPGIPENKLKTIFERFYSERPDAEDYGRHSGLGLNICKQIIKAHNGIIYAENIKDREGKVSGARFVIMLKLMQPASKKSDKNS